MHTSNLISNNTPLPLTEELALYKRYLKMLEHIAGLLLEKTSEQSLSGVLRLLSETTGVGCCALFLNKTNQHDQQIAKLNCTWSTGEAVSRLSNFDHFRELEFQRYPLLFDALQVGMVFCKHLPELSPAEAALFATQNIQTALCVPLLMDDEMEGFIGLFSQHTARNWHTVEIDVICAVANSIALALTRKQAEQSLEVNAHRLRTLVGSTEDMIIEYDQNHQILNVWTDNHAFPITLENHAQGLALEIALPYNMAQAILSASTKLRTQQHRETFEFTLRIHDEDRFFLGRLQTIPAETTDMRNTVALIRDISDLMHEEAQRLSMLETLNLLEEAIIDLSTDGLLLNFSAAWGKLLDVPADREYTHIGQPLTTFVCKEDRAALAAVIQQLAVGKLHSQVIRFRLLHGEEPIWIEAHLLAHHGHKHEITGLRGVLRDITTSHLQERRITQLALHDALTQLPNRILLEDHLQQAIARATRTNDKVALGFIDLDHFKHINDTMGHKAGDTVLVTLSQRLSAVLRSVDTLSRWGGDEFVVLLPEANNEAHIRNIAERLRDAARASIDIDGNETKLTISIGFAIYPDDADSAETLMSVADHTMFHAKGVGRNNVQFFQDIHDKTLDRENVLMQTRLSHAIHNKTIQVFFQPVVDTRTQEIVSFEALARWHDDENGWIPPATFIPMAEHLGIIQELGDQVFDHTLQRLQVWHETHGKIQASVNISRAQLFTPAFVQNLLDKVQHYGLQPQDVILEITESVALLDLSYESKRLQELHDAGFTLAIDDFGTGYSALSQLHAMPIDILKIDSSFTSRLDTTDGQRIVQAIVQMADALSLKMIVEGVESDTTVQYLQSIGVHYIQGHFFSEASPAGVCQLLLQESVSLFS
ncbi:bifunctional diguanylate cyclase/phosphodiesterase [Sulfuriferula nivalis]|uniref:EAL domain-containing protein n=1 Tax=Sulfuriferula nivalis TaxID=2675298 RepID=A0A809RNH8_9PROT|nr:EAL domain-containing protein [Sulfuriferula nivalis]BBP02334.1 hypothetical protein SFSGTM_30420 [Sulfuriferula nivalis]